MKFYVIHRSDGALHVVQARSHSEAGEHALENIPDGVQVLGVTREPSELSPEECLRFVAPRMCLVGGRVRV